VTVKTRSILVVDDDPLVLTLVDHALRSTEFRVITAHDGIDALEQVGDCRPGVDIALIDVMMPRMNGKELAGKLVSSCPGIRIIFMSGYGPDIASHSIPGPDRPFLEKPFDLADLLKTIREEMQSISAAGSETDD
jgi:two-component system, cell cycle sensor histidine kinase and response regulator CckA